MHSNLKSHYRNEDLSLAETAFGQFLVAMDKAKATAENAQFEAKEVVFTEMRLAYENLELLNRKKIEEDVTTQAMAYIRNYYHG